MSNRQVKAFFTGQEPKEMVEKQKEWTTKLAPTAQVASPMYQVLVHDMPLSFEPESHDQIKLLQQANALYLQGIRIQKAAWLKRSSILGKSSGSLILWFDEAESADRAITKGVMWRYEVKPAELFRSGVRAMQCFNCQKYGHIAKVCTAEAKCGQCAKAHNTRVCTGKQEAKDRKSVV